MIRINERLQIPESELTFTASRGGGPGGQHVNKVASRVTLAFDVAGSPSLSEVEREQLLDRLSSRLTQEGVLQLSSHESRSQASNREQVTERFATLLRAALQPRKKRRATRPTRGSRERRIRNKKERAEVKRGRGRVRRPID